jgi:hypothetical protein
VIFLEFVGLGYFKFIRAYQVPFLEAEQMLIFEDKVQVITPLLQIDNCLNFVVVFSMCYPLNVK